MNNGEITIEKNTASVADIVRGRFAVTDKNVYALYKPLFKDALGVCVLDSGEQSKTLATAEKILLQMAGNSLDRKSVAVAVGGGVVGDLTGFCASVYMRGIDFVNVPTTLLAAVDSSVGGKTGVNLDRLKNLVGAFHKPKHVHIRTDFFATLPERELICGLGEAYKTALLDRGCMKAWNALPEKTDSFTDFSAVVEACVRFKKSVTDSDYRESGKRKILNLGHTVAHAIEYLDGYERSHGEYVLMGLIAESGMAAVSGKIRRDTYESIRRGCLSIIGESGERKVRFGFSSSQISSVAMHDKKNSGGRISLIISEDFCQREYLLDKYEFTKEMEMWKSIL